MTNTGFCVGRTEKDWAVGDTVRSWGFPNGLTVRAIVRWPAGLLELACEGIDDTGQLATRRVVVLEDWSTG